MDANGDGSGAFQGLSRPLEYLHGLGVTAIWLMPFQCSPGRDDGYDISDYYSVNPAYGSLGDFVEFTHGAKQRGIRVLIDLVVNHTSDQHRWFQEARRDPDSKYRDWYIWSDKRPRNAGEGMVFPGVQKTTWTHDKIAKRWFFHRFYDFQPDLNTSHPAVQAEILKIMGFWIQLGVSGFRMDAVPFVISTKGADVERPREQYDMLRDFREFLQWRVGDSIILAEANVLPRTDMNYFGDAGDRMHMMFNFQVNQNLFYALASADTRPLIKAMQRTERRPASGQWCMFLRNHDELDLGRLSQVQRQQVFDAFGPNKEDQLYDRGIRRRLAPARLTGTKMPASFARKLAHLIELSERELDVLRAMPAQVRDVPARADIVVDSEWPAELSLITEGFACRYKQLGDGRRQIMAFLIPGDICDLRALLTGRMDHAVAALNSNKIASIPRHRIFDAIEKHPRIELALWRDTMLDAALYRQWLINIGRRSPYRRLAHPSCEVGTRLRAIGRAQGGTYELPVTQSHLAEAMGLSLVHVNRHLKLLRENGLITFRANEVCVPDWDRLRSAAEFDAGYLQLRPEPSIFPSNYIEAARDE